MARTTKADLQAMHDSACRAAQIASGALHYLGAGDPPDCREVVTAGCEPGESYELRAYGLDRADGGILVVTFRYPGQRPGTSAHYFEEYHVGAQRTACSLGDELACAIRNACDRFASFRNVRNAEVA